MGLISRVSSRTYRDKKPINKATKFPNRPKWPKKRPRVSSVSAKSNRLFQDLRAPAMSVKTTSVSVVQYVDFQVTQRKIVSTWLESRKQKLETRRQDFWNCPVRALKT